MPPFFFAGVSLHKCIRVLDEYDRLIAVLSPDVLRPKSKRLTVQDNPHNEFFVQLKKVPKSLQDDLDDPPELEDDTLEYYSNLHPDNNIDYTYKPHCYPNSRPIICF